jgi:hypothetical protein
MNKRNESIKIGSLDVEHQFNPYGVKEYQEKYAEIMTRLNANLKRLSDAGIRGRKFRRLSDVACMTAIQELKDEASKLKFSRKNPRR